MKTCSPPDQLILQDQKQPFNRHNRCILKDKQNSYSHESSYSQSFLDNPCKQAQHRLRSHQCKLHQALGSNRHKHLHNRCKLHHLETVEMLWTALLALMSHSGQLVLEEAAVARMEVVHHPHSLPLLAPNGSRHRVRLSPSR